uniref:Interleukin-23 receptor-like n=1 Tax=Sinocyclocheilus anshuiensis TaxID=1608454 RepID=A0A671T0G3_9TELE
MGSNLTVGCQSNTEHCGRHFAIVFNGQTIFETVNCSVIKTQIVINQPSFWLLCKVKEGDTWHTVCGQDFKAGLIPSTPEITRVVFENGTLSPTIYWNGSEDNLKPILRFREAHYDPDWRLGSVKELLDGCILMQEALEPLILYQFELRVCVTSTNCSMWSHPFNITSPGIAPSHKLDVWRVINRTSTHGPLNVTVLWKHYKPEYYSGDVLYYKLSYKEEGKIRELNCSAHVTHQTLQLSTAEVNVSAVTAAGSSPPAPVSLTYTGKPAPMITHLVPAAGGSVLLAWDVSHYSEEAKGILGFVVQWQQSPVHIEWKRLGKDYNITFLQGMRAGVLYNISLYTEEASRVSDPAFVQVYAKEEKPLAGPDVSITNIGKKQILIQWDELSQETQRGFITNYTIYFQRHIDERLLQNRPLSSVSFCVFKVTAPAGTNETKQLFLNMWLQETVPYAFTRPLSWELQGQQECFDILVSAWNSAGEGPKGKPATCCCHSKLSYQAGSDKTTVSSLSFVQVVSQCVSCLQYFIMLKSQCVCVCNCYFISQKNSLYRMMKMCMSIGVSWIFENLPKFDNSNAIKLLKDDSYGPWGALPGDSDPPLTPIEEVCLSLERQDSYPTVLHVTEMPTTDLFCIDSPYKPQQLTASQRNEDFSETTEEELKEEDQFPLLVSPSHHDFSWDLTCIPVIHRRLNSFLAMDGALGSLGILEDLLAPPQTASNEDGGVEENERIVETGDVNQSTFTSQTVLPNDLESCLRGPVFDSSPYSPQGLCQSFSVPEEG